MGEDPGLLQVSGLLVANKLLPFKWTFLVRRACGLEPTGLQPPLSTQQEDETKKTQSQQFFLRVCV